jgi:glycosyltransferase involved in cell wall biosynthesis
MTVSTQDAAEHDDRPLVSVVVIFLNAERFIVEAVESVFAQTYTNWELLLVDDGSTDQSTEVAREYARAHPQQVRYFDHEHHGNRGQGASRNAGITHALGDFVALLDADDAWVPHKLERQVEIFRLFPRAAMVCGQSLYWTSWNGSPGNRDVLARPVGEPQTLMEPPALLRRWLKGERTIASSSNIMFRRSMTRRTGGFPDPFPRLYEDLAFMIKVFLSEPVFVADECWDRVRRHPDSCIARATASEWNAAWFFFLSWLERYLRKSGFQNSEFWQPLQRDLWPFRHPVLFRLSRLRDRATALIRG